MASRKFLDVLIRDYMSVLNSGDYADVILRIGDDEHFKEFRAHSIVLRTRSPYFRTALSDRWAQKQDNVIIYEKPNILPEAFEVILNGVLELKLRDVKVVLNILVACKELCLLDLFDYMQDYLLNNMSEAMQQNFSLVQHFFQKVTPYKEAIDQDLYGEILKFHSSAATKSKSTIPLSQRRGVDSVLIGVKHLHLFSRWIDNKPDSIYSRNNIPYEFKLLLRGSRNGFTPQEFHDLCDEKGPTLVVAKIKNSNEIVGGFNPVSWDSSDALLEVKNSFVFSLDENLDDSILSRSVGTISSICNSPLHGPVFRGILIFNGDFKNDCASYCNFDKATTPYEGPIRNTKDKFSVEELE
ncbi:998_t:CDS:2, partial [Cetraspora pellucida]